MSPEDIGKLLGGYATGTLTPEEQQALFAAALEDQELFDALAKEQALHDLLRDPAARAQLLSALDSPTAPAAGFWQWLHRPMAAGFAMAGVAVLGVAIFATWQHPRWLGAKPVIVAEVRNEPHSPVPHAPAASTLPAQEAAPAASAPAGQPQGAGRNKGDAGLAAPPPVHEPASAKVKGAAPTVQEQRSALGIAAGGGAYTSGNLKKEESSAVQSRLMDSAAPGRATADQAAAGLRAEKAAALAPPPPPPPPALRGAISAQAEAEQKLQANNAVRAVQPSLPARSGGALGTSAAGALDGAPVPAKETATPAGSPSPATGAARRGAPYSPVQLANVVPSAAPAPPASSEESRRRTAAAQPAEADHSRTPSTSVQSAAAPKAKKTAAKTAALPAPALLTQARPAAPEPAQLKAGALAAAPQPAAPPQPVPPRVAGESSADALHQTAALDARTVFYFTSAPAAADFSTRTNEPAREIAVPKDAAPVPPTMRLGVRISILRAKGPADLTTVLDPGETVRLRLTPNTDGFLAIGEEGRTVTTATLQRLKPFETQPLAFKGTGQKQLMVVFSKTRPTAPPPVFSALVGGRLLQTPADPERATYIVNGPTADPQQVVIPITLTYR